MIKRPNLRILGVEEGAEIQTKGIEYLFRAGCQWLMPVILITQEAEIRIVV
jgi:hypothetical protein